MRLNCHIVNDGYNEKKVWKMHYDTFIESLSAMIA